MQINSTKKNNLLKIVKNQRNYDYSSYLIEKLIKEKKLNHLIEKIDDIKVKLPNSNIEKKDYFIGEEQFISILDKFIHYFKGTFIMPDVISDCSIRNILTINNPNLDFLFSKVYVYDNNYIEYFKNQFNRAIVYSFIFNLNELKHCSTIIENFIKKYNLNIDNINNKDIEKNAIILKKLVLSNYKEINLNLLFLNYQFYFDDKKRSSLQKENISFQFFITVYEMFIEEYYKKEKTIDELIQ